MPDGCTDVGRKVENGAGLLTALLQAPLVQPERLVGKNQDPEDISDHIYLM
jgi:hypothetical protein